MPRDMILPGAIAGLAVVAVVAGLSLTGGPARGKAEQRDQARLAALRDAHELVECLARTNNRTLPEVLEADASCPDVEVLNDPYTGTPIRFERLDETRYLLCPDLELPDDFENDHWIEGGHFKATSGCVRYEYHP